MAYSRRVVSVAVVLSESVGVLVGSHELGRFRCTTFCIYPLFGFKTDQFASIVLNVKRSLWYCASTPIAAQPPCASHVFVLLYVL